ncbi:MAG: flagellar hook-length control protein FliK [Eubacterium sp.]|nr:flagellar hook-length control protein FliK [Eubacterium sp.]
MQISYVGQYNKNANQVVGTPVPAATVSSLTAALKELMPGSIFEGNISYIKGSNVILSLENGQNVRARLDQHALKLVQGQSMFFQVKSNEGGVVAIRPYMGNGKANPTLIRALQAAGLPTTEKNLDMVNAMMKEQMPIHAEALQNMYRSVVSHEGIHVNTLVQMTKLEMPITPQLAVQFENYRNDTHALLGQMNDFIEQMPVFLETQSADVPQMVQMNTQMLAVLTEGLAEEPLVLPQEQNLNAEMPSQAMPMSEAATVLPQDAPETLEGMFLSEVADEAVDGQKHLYQPNQIGGLFSAQTHEDVSDVLRSIGNLIENEAVFDENGSLNKNLTARQLLGFIDRELQTQLKMGMLEADDVKDIFSNKGYQELLKHVCEEQWLLQPQQVKEPEKISALYERLERQMEQMEQILKSTGNEQSALSHATEQIRGNVDFMNEVNQIYNYVQLPLKMNGQSANGELYVYTNKRKLREENGELSAFLHLDMEHLGSTDVYVKMKGKAVQTDFSFSDDESYALVQKYLPILDAKLAALGYQVTITVNQTEEKMNFVEDFLKKDLPGGSTDRVHRYSFDVRA